jgi:hypothetical protein
VVPPHRSAAHRIPVAGRSYADFAITVFGVAGAEGKAMGSACARVPLAAACRPVLQHVALCCSVSPCAAMCRPVLQRVVLCCSVARSAWHWAVTTVPCAVKRSARPVASAKRT